MANLFWKTQEGVKALLATQRRPPWTSFPQMVD